MISYGLWQRRFGGAPGVVGRPISVNGVPATIVGVTPRGFQGAMQVGASPSVFVPLAAAARLERHDQHFDPNHWWVLMLARLQPGTTAEAAGAAMASIVRGTVLEHRPSVSTEAMPRIVLEPGARGQLEERRGMVEPLRVLAIVVAIVLLAAIANVAGLMQMRANARVHETAVRLSLGATRWRLVRQAQTECLLVGGLAGIVALPVTVAVAHVLLPALGRDDSMALEMGIDGSTTLLTLAVACVATVLCGAAASFRRTVPGAIAAAAHSTRSVPGGARQLGPGGLLVGAQMALCLVLVSGASLLAMTVRNLDRIDPGFDASSLLLFRIDPSLTGYEGDRLVALYDRLLASIRSLPGVESATVSAHTPIADSASILQVRLPGDPPPESEADAPGRVRRPLVWRQTVEDAYFRTMRIPVLAGRTLDARDSQSSHKVAVVNAQFMRDVLGGGPAVGRRFHLGGAADAPQLEIIGVVGDARFSRMRADVPPTAYVSYRQQSAGAMTFEVRTAGDPAASVPAVRRAVAEGAPGVPLFDVRTQEAQIAHSLRRERLFARLATMLGAVTLILCAVGVYGLLATHVTRRTPEVGVRMALGAAPATVRWMVIRQALLLAGGGAAVGVPAAFGGLRVVGSLLYGVRPTDPLAIGAAVVLLAALGVLAAWLPARRASRVDPVVALRQS
jgi:predicted permease